MDGEGLDTAILSISLLLLAADSYACNALRQGMQSQIEGHVQHRSGRFSRHVHLDLHGALDWRPGHLGRQRSIQRIGRVGGSGIFDEAVSVNHVCRVNGRGERRERSGTCDVNDRFGASFKAADLLILHLAGITRLGEEQEVSDG